MITRLLYKIRTLFLSREDKERLKQVNALLSDVSVMTGILLSKHPEIKKMSAYEIIVHCVQSIVFTSALKAQGLTTEQIVDKVKQLSEETNIQETCVYSESKGDVRNVIKFAKKSDPDSNN